MPTLDEVMGAKTSFAADAATGVQVLSEMGTKVFDLYTRVVLPLDGYVFWVKSADPATSITVQGSFHYDTEFRQDETNNYAASRCVFTALSEVNDLRDIAPGTAYICTEGNMKFAFSSRGYFYKTADLYHYRGYATYNDVLNQVVENGTDLLAADVIVSNSLPIWLAFNTYTAAYRFTTAGVTLFPSFLVPDNEPPPFASVNVIPESTQAIGGAPRLLSAPVTVPPSPGLYHSQLVQERVKVTFYGLRNQAVLQFIDFVNQYTEDTRGVLGIMNQPTVRDEHRTQSELRVLGQKKSIEFQVNYYQSTAFDIAQQLINEAAVTYTPQ